MANLDNIVENTMVLTEDSENRVDRSGSNAVGNWVTLSDAQKDDDGTVVAKRIVDTEIVLESIFDDNCCLGLVDKEKELVGGLSSTGDGAKDVSGGIVDGVLGRDVKINIGDVSYLNNEENESKKSEEIGRNVEMCRNGNGRWNGEKLEDGNHGFRVGDLVWGKVRSYPWWPGQIYDPRDASEFAVKHSQEGRLLVAFFGDGSCSWCLPSQLVTFIENFKQMSKDGSSKSVLNAVQKAVDEVGRLVESRLTCKCVQKKDHLARPVVANAGVKAGVLVPEVDIDRFCIPEYEPDEILTKVVNFAKGVSVDNTFELGILRSSLSAFYNAKCGHPLPVYNEPYYIEGLEDNEDNETELSKAFNLSIEVPTQGPEDDRMNTGRKQRSVAEIMRKRNDDEPKRKKKSVNGSSLKRLKTVNGEMHERSSNGPSSMRKTSSQKRMVEADSAEEKLKKVEFGEGKEEIENATSPRERKRSKYLSPPYTNLDWRILNSSFKMKPDSDKYITRSSDDEMADVEELNDQQKLVGESSKTNALVLDNDKRLSFSKSDINIPVNELMSEIEFTAVDPFFLSNKGSFDKVWGFVSAFRGSIYVQGSDYGVYQKSIGNECDDLISDVSLIRDKLDMMTAMLEDYCSKISIEAKESLKEEMKHLMEHVETASDKVRLVAENAASS